MNLNQTESPLNETLVPRWKRVLDITILLLASPVLLLVGGAVALVVLSVSRGPLFYRQQRMGLMGKPFTIFKFRTMRVNADTSAFQKYLTERMNNNTSMLKMDGQGDARIIPLGRWIRALGLDELPQVINVLIGNMTLVGPRPSQAFECANYTEWHKQRFNTLPGVTGLWQVSGKNNTTFQKMVELDIEYSRTKSVALDLSIIIRTIPAIITQTLEMRRTRQQAAAQTVQIPSLSKVA